jgi:hypothetical protein
VLQAKKSQEITVTFKSKEAKVMIALIAIKLTDVQSGQELNRSLKVSAIGKYPFITLDQSSIDFDTLLVGKTETREVTIVNSSQVPTHFDIEKVTDDGKDHSLRLSHNKADLAPGATSTVLVTYTPSIPDVITCAYFKVISTGGNELTFQCRGQAEGYNVEMSAKSLHFGEVNINTETNRILNVMNNSDLPTSCQFITDPNNIFSFS